MGGNASTKELLKTQANPETHPNRLRDDEIERELHMVEELILAVYAADAFVEDLVSLHSRRHALLAVLRRAKERGYPVDLASRRKRAMPMSYLAEESNASAEVDLSVCKKESGHDR
jgi:hypothetical protein